MLHNKSRSLVAAWSQLCAFGYAAAALISDCQADKEWIHRCRIRYTLLPAEQTTWLGRGQKGWWTCLRFFLRWDENAFDSVATYT
jgi:hypothetical protein